MTAAAVSDDVGVRVGAVSRALVLADGGIACVDEIDKMQSDAVSSMHDALESQQVHVDKAVINATLNLVFPRAVRLERGSRDGPSERGADRRWARLFSLGST